MQVDLNKVGYAESMATGEKVQGFGVDHKQMGEPSPMQKRFEEVLDKLTPADVTGEQLVNGIAIAAAAQWVNPVFHINFDQYEFTEDGVIKLTQDVADAFVKYKQGKAKIN